MKPLLSIVVPVYNVEKTLEDCISSICNSVLHCHENHTYELILVEDCSTDKSRSIAEKIALSTPHCKIVCHDINQGLAMARNTGLQEASGKYVAWVDSDDIVTTDWFEAITTALVEYSPEVVAFDYTRKDLRGRNIHDEYGKIRFSLPEAGGFVSASVWIKDVLRSLQTFAFAWTKVFRRDFLSCGYDAPRGALEDMGLMLSVANKVNNVYYIPKQLYIYRIASTSLVGTLDSARRLLHAKYAFGKIKQLPFRLKIAAMVSIAQLMVEVRRTELNVSDVTVTMSRRECMKYMRSALPYVLLDAELPVKAKMVYIMSGFECFSPILRKIWK